MIGLPPCEILFILVDILGHVAILGGVTETRTKTDNFTGAVVTETTADDTDTFKVYQPLNSVLGYDKWDAFAALAPYGPVSEEADKSGHDHLVVDYEFRWVTITLGTV